MTRRTPPLASALQHALVAAMAITYLVAAATQIHRDNLPLAAINLLIAGLLGVLLELNKKRYGRLFANFSVRKSVKRLRQNEVCGWCGEEVAAKAPAVTHRGAVEGEPFILYHHPECDHAITQWYLQNSDETTIDLPLPKQGSMRRGSPHPRD